MSVMSMTGFGSATFTLGGQAWRIEAKSVTHKALSLRAHLPPSSRTASRPPRRSCVSA